MDLTQFPSLSKASRRRPLIGITGPSQGGNWFWIATAWAVWRAGGLPIRLTPKRAKKRDKDLAGLILSGGRDIDPRIYQQEEVFHAYHSTQASKPLDLHERDRFEFGLYQLALLEQIPILGICRGAQLINVAQGGSLHQNIQPFYPGGKIPRGIWPVKEIHLKRDAKLRAIFPAPTLRVNALHFQAIDRLGEGLTILAKELNGIVQAIALEGERYPFVWGVQWHPEFLPFTSSQQSLFQAFVRIADKGIKKDLSWNHERPDILFEFRQEK